MTKIKRLLNLFIFSLFLVLLFLPFTAYASTQPSIPPPTNYKYLNDYTSTISENDAKSIISIGKELEDKTGAQAVIVIIDSTDGAPIEDYAIKLFRSWGIGQKNKDNGLLILLSLNDKAWRVEVGRGLEGAIPDALSNRVMDSIAKPSFITGNYGEGLLNSYSAYSDYIASEYNVTLEKSLHIKLPNNTNPNTTTSSESNFGMIVGGGILVLLFLLDVFLNGGRISSTLLQLIFISNLGRRNGPRGGSGGGGGGFGGFGGGSSNGGGSSGGW